MSTYFDSLTIGMIFTLDGVQYEVLNTVLSLALGDCMVGCKNKSGAINAFSLAHLRIAYNEGRIGILGYGSFEERAKNEPTQS